MASKYGWPTAPQGVGTCAAAPFQNECTSNFYNAPKTPAPVHRYFGRLDYDLSAKHRIMFSISQKDNPGVDNGLFNCPLNCGSGDVDGWNTQVTETWTITPTIVNEIRMGYTKQGNWFQSQSLGLNPATAFGLQDTHFNQFPFIGNSSIYGGFGGPYAVNTLSPATDAIYIENSFDPSDMVTLVKGKHILHFGIEVLMAEGNTTAWGSNSAGNYGFTGQYTAGVNCQRNAEYRNHGLRLRGFPARQRRGLVREQSGPDGHAAEEPAGLRSRRLENQAQSHPQPRLALGGEHGHERGTE